MERHRFFSFYPRRGMLYVRFKPIGSRLWGSGKSTGFSVSERADAEYAVRAYLDGLRPSFRKGDCPLPSALPARELLDLQHLFELVRVANLTPDHVRQIETIVANRKLAERGQRPELVTFLEEFWDYDRSKYVERQLATGHRMSRRHCYDQTRHVRNHWRTYFKDLTLPEVQLSDLEDFSSYLRKLGLKGKTINNITDAGTIALSWCFERNLIPSDPTSGFVRAAADSDERGVLTPSEVKQLFEFEWPDPRAKLGNLLACVCGLRSGEVRALRVKDLESDDGRTFIARSWNRHDLFTDPKWGSFRDATIPQRIREGLLNQAKTGPHKYRPDLLLFAGVKPDKPRESEYLLDALKTMLLKLNPDPEFWKNRKVVFHSWRHYFTSRMADILDEPTLMKATGHRTKDAFDEYVHHMTPEQLQKVGSAQSRIFAEVVN